jgi:predicted dehydrogenase
MRYLLVGFGNIGAKRRAALGERCVATVDPYNAGADYRTPAACPPARYDAAILAVPNQAKLELLEVFLGLGKHVLVEKPLLFPDRATVDQLARRARDRGVLWYTAYNHRFEPLVASLKRHLEAEAIGRIYHGRFLYGNGTVGNVVGTWRDEGLGVLDDLIPHLVDLAGHLLGIHDAEFLPMALGRHEAKSLDHCLLITGDRRFTLEASFLCWKNSFGIELFGERGSLHLQGLVKWGPSGLVLRQRVFPSGVPVETHERAEGPDASWARELEHFETLRGTGRTSAENDWWISRTILAAGAS